MSEEYECLTGCSIPNPGCPACDLLKRVTDAEERLARAEDGWGKDAARMADVEERESRYKKALEKISVDGRWAGQFARDALKKGSDAMSDEERHVHDHLNHERDPDHCVLCCDQRFADSLSSEMHIMFSELLAIYNKSRKKGTAPHECKTFETVKVETVEKRRHMGRPDMVLRSKEWRCVDCGMPKG